MDKNNDGINFEENGYKNKKTLNKQSDIFDNMKKSNKIFIGVLGGSTLGMLIFSIPAIHNFFILWNFLAKYSLVISILGIIVGGILGFLIARNA